MKFSSVEIDDSPVIANGMIRFGFPNTVGEQFAVDILALDRPLEGMVISLRHVRAENLISAFFGAFMKRLHQEDPDYAEAATKIVWETDHDFQRESILEWMIPWKMDTTLICPGVRHLEKPQHVQIGLTPGFELTVLNVVSHDGMSYSVPISDQAAEVLIANGMGYEG